MRKDDTWELEAPAIFTQFTLKKGKMAEMAEFSPFCHLLSFLLDSSVFFSFFFQILIYSKVCDNTVNGLNG